MASTSSQLCTREVNREPPPSGDNPIQNLSRFMSDSLIQQVTFRVMRMQSEVNLTRSATMLSHVSLGANDADCAAAFYDPVLAVLGIPQDRRA